MKQTRSGAAPSIAIVTVAEDLHAHVVKKALEDKHGVPCAILETDRLAGRGQINWSPDGDSAPALPAFGGASLDPRQLDLVWWRRPSGNPWRKSASYLADVTDEAAQDIVKNDCLASFQGVLFNETSAIWVSDPDATRRAENKLWQLQAARQVGLRVPRTLVSQNPDAIRAFCAQQLTIVKTVAGTTKTPLMAQEVSAELLTRDDSLSLSPAIYQACVMGRQHLRVHAFGNAFHTALLTCDQLDWRIHLDKVTVQPYELAPVMQDQLRRLMQLMNLRMGIFDLKINEQGELVWLEVNPQGQFLFVEGMSELKLVDAFADYLFHTAQARERVAA